MRFGLLGPVEVWSGSRSLARHARPQQRTLLAALLDDLGRLATPDELIGRIWGESPPPTARRTLHSHISRIRNLLTQEADAGAPRLLFRDGCYLLLAPAEAVDAQVFRRLVQEAGQQEAHERVRLLRDALSLWRGEALSGLPGPWAERRREMYRRQRVRAILDWADSLRDLGQANRSLEALERTVESEPLTEPVTARLVAALYTEGYASDALRSYHAFSRQLADELGTVPGPTLRRLHTAIVQGRPLPELG
ncbi:AfsR/SARP family transcriptional regulator [Streptomyces sulphureus]|uniref:AfsR/SARP family transcriptional regulator n=1 Tax=Streptomyces sulphureus TaxID=47758 RepID=UPI00037F72EE|nr:BTAD domain-containing putative transcriptional regulator [Streptomyces sulphureus]